MLWDTGKFMNLIEGCFCICLTATPDNNDKKGAHSHVIKSLGFSRYDYVFSDEFDELAEFPLTMEADALVDAFVDAPTTEKKAEYIVQ